MNIIKLLRNYLLLLKSDFFDSKYYLKENPDVAKAKVNPILHYLKFGWKEGRNPSSLFNTNDYISFRPDILKADICPLVHYELFGKREFLSFCFDKIKYFEKKISDLDTKFNKKTSDLDTKINNLDIKFNKKTFDLDKFKNKLLFTYENGINKEKISSKIEKYLESNESGITNEKRTPELIVSLTSYPDRMYDIHYCIYSLLTQSLKPNKIILWLAEEQFLNKNKDLPIKLLEFVKYGLEIKYTKDIRSYKKLIPTLKGYPNAIIVTADDDIFYPQDWLEKLYNCWKNNRDCVICHRAHRVGIENEKLIQYNKWEHTIISDKPGFDIFFTGAGGILYPLNCFYKDIFDEELFMKLTPNADDIFFWAMAVLNDKKIKIVDDDPFRNPIYVNSEREVGLNNDSTLCSSNVHENRNDIQFENVINHYPHIMGKLLDE